MLEEPLLVLTAKGVLLSSVKGLLWEMNTGIINL
jgi:hypothetical protein